MFCSISFITKPIRVKLNELVEDHRKIRSTYIFYVYTEFTSKGDREKEEQQS